MMRGCKWNFPLLKCTDWSSGCRSGNFFPRLFYHFLLIALKKFFLFHSSKLNLFSFELRNKYYDFLICKFVKQQCCFGCRTTKPFRKTWDLMNHVVLFLHTTFCHEAFSLKLQCTFSYQVIFVLYGKRNSLLYMRIWDVWNNIYNYLMKCKPIFALFCKMNILIRWLRARYCLILYNRN